MNGCRITKVFKIDNQLVIADSIEEAIHTYKKYLNDDCIEIKNIGLITGDSLGMMNTAIIEE